MEVTLKNRELVDLFDAMKQISETEKNNKWFTYAVTLNEQNLMPKVIAIIECGKPANEYKSFEAEREKLIDVYVERDEDGNYVVDESTQMIKIKNEFIVEAKQKFDELDKNNESIRIQRQNDINEYYALLDKETTVDIEQISLDNFPNYMNKIMMKSLQPLIAKTIIED